MASAVVLGSLHLDDVMTRKVLREELQAQLSPFFQEMKSLLRSERLPHEPKTIDDKRALQNDGSLNATMGLREFYGERAKSSKAKISSASFVLQSAMSATQCLEPSRGASNRQVYPSSQTELSTTPGRLYKRNSTSLESEGMPEAKSCNLTENAKWLIKSRYFDHYVLISIVAHFIFTCLDADYMAKHPDSEQPPVCRVIEYVLIANFCIEVMVRMVAWQRFFFMVNLDDGPNPHFYWNVIDFALAIYSVIERVWKTSAWTTYRGSSTGSAFLRILRSVRLLRLTRLWIVLKSTRDFRVIVLCITKSLPTLFWSVVALLLTTLIFALHFVNLVASWKRGRASGPSHNEDVDKYFGSLTSAGVSLLMAVTGGVDWEALYFPILSIGGPFFGAAPFLIYVLFSVVAIMNVISGIFTDTAMLRAREQRELWLLRSAQEVFRAADFDKSGRISWDDFEKGITSMKQVKSFFQEIDIDISQAKQFFELLDLSRDGEISADEFLSGCLRVKGLAKSLDLLVLSREVRQILDAHMTELTSVKKQISSALAQEL
eukprot:TRINITY_DN4591_c0_g1_i4.p1 TRINITY_DN4591_c0_g1~~TRINITY_DN4591_c0_g1_i4.p1  ORF type:complete len:546 (+),score=84.10 TRINITY_DN4591_c0_g1_i4:69-1706(+)